MTDDTKHVAVLMGGWTSEREVSLSSGKACADALRAEGYKVTEIDVQSDIADQLKAVQPDVCFNALHGPFGEDGCIQGLLEIMKIPYTHSGVMGSSIAMNKLMTKTILEEAGVPVARDKVVIRAEAAMGHMMPPPYVLKPISDGSSVGIFIVLEGAELPPSAKILAAGADDDELMIEEFIPGLELTCTVMGNRALDVLEILPNGDHEFYDYASKYEEGGSQHVIPAEISSNIYQFIQKWSLVAHRALGLRGVSRSDFRFDPETETLICLEVNTQPGMTVTSLVPEMAEKAGYSFNELVSWIVEDASCNR